MTFTDEFILELIGCPKIVTTPPSKKLKEELGYQRNSFEMVSPDELYSFSAFIRINLHFKENFSVGLKFHPKGDNKQIILLRCNGVHGENKAFPHHHKPHIHYTEAEDINIGVIRERKIELTEEYFSYQEALYYFVNRINLQSEDRTKHFINPNNTTLFNQNGEN